MRDFQNEREGCLPNETVVGRFESLPLKAGVELIAGNLQLCYDELALVGVVEPRELKLLEAWLADVAAVEGMGSNGHRLPEVA